MTIDGFDWNADLQPSDFEPNIPPDYTVMAKVDLSGSVEAVSKGLRGFAQITEGRYPTNLDLMTTSQEIREAFIALRKKQGKNGEYPVHPGSMYVLRQIGKREQGCRLLRR
jgi:hypothetical protein